jgi:hypothetical protein
VKRGELVGKMGSSRRGRHTAERVAGRDVNQDGPYRALWTAYRMKDLIRAGGCQSRPNSDKAEGETTRRRDFASSHLRLCTSSQVALHHTESVRTSTIPDGPGEFKLSASFTLQLALVSNSPHGYSP